MKCPICLEEIPDHSRFCNMCGIRLEDAKAQIEREQQAGLRPMIEREIHTEYGTKLLQVYCRDIADFPEQMDLLTVSAFTEHYEPVPRTVIGALYEKKQISVKVLSEKPLLDARKAAGCWISQEIPLTEKNPNIYRIGCVELSRFNRNQEAHEAENEKYYFKVLKAYFRLIDVLSAAGTELKTVVLPILGSGQQHLDMDIVSIPLVSEVLELLQRNPAIERLIFVERTYAKALKLVETISNAYCFNVQSAREIQYSRTENPGEPNVFISYCTNGDTEAAELLAACLEKRGIKAWFAPSNIRSGDYAEAIVQGINACTHFVCLVSRNSMHSEHVLNEIDLAFRRLSEGVKIMPVQLDDSEMRASFLYYLARMQWTRADMSSLERCYDELIDTILTDR